VTWRCVLSSDEVHSGDSGLSSGHPAHLRRQNCQFFPTRRQLQEHFLEPQGTFTTDLADSRYRVNSVYIACDNSMAVTCGFPPKAPEISRQRGIREHALFPSADRTTTPLLTLPPLYTLCCTFMGAASAADKLLISQSSWQPRPNWRLHPQSCHTPPPPDLGRGSVRPNVLTQPPMRAWAQDEGALGSAGTAKGDSELEPATGHRDQGSAAPMSHGDRGSAEPTGPGFRGRQRWRVTAIRGLQRQRFKGIRGLQLRRVAGFRGRRRGARASLSRPRAQVCLAARFWRPSRSWRLASAWSRRIAATHSSICPHPVNVSFPSICFFPGGPHVGLQCDNSMAVTRGFPPKSTRD